MMSCKWLVVFFIFLSLHCFSQRLQPGFDAKEYLSVLSIAYGKKDSLSTLLPDSQFNFSRFYQSDVVGLDNRWELWLRNDQQVAVISVRGTVATQASWLSNLYSAMQPATGNIKLNDTITFQYKLSENPNAAVHTGWLLSLGFMAKDIEQKLIDLHRKGVKDILLVGHSQGAGIAYLLRSYLYYRTKDGTLPDDITYKTYCSAAPKPGNLYFAYEYDYITRSNWGFTVINAADWVPEIPFGIQQLTDINVLNPFTNVKASLRKQNYFIRVYAAMVFHKLKKATYRSARLYRNYFGKKAGKQVRKKLPQLQELPFTNTLNFQRAGIPVILLPDAAYYKLFPNNPKSKLGIWTHHGYDAYKYLTEKQFLSK